MSDINEIEWTSRNKNNNKRKRQDNICNEITKKQKTDEDSNENENSTVTETSIKNDTKLDKSTITVNQIYSNNNNVYFNTNITTNSIISLEKEVQKIVTELVKKSQEIKNLEFTISYPPIILHIDSNGGSLFAAFRFIDYMTQIKIKYPEIKFHSIVSGRAASAASLISVTADLRHITEYGYILIHQLSSFTSGKYNEIKDDITNLDSLMEKIKQIYRKHTKIPENQLDEILKHDIYWDANTCKEYELVDIIIRS